MIQLLLGIGVALSLALNFVRFGIPAEIGNKIHELTENIDRIVLRTGVTIPEKVATGNLGSPTDRFRFLGGQKYRMGGSGASSSDTSITLQSFTLPNSGTEITMSDFGGDIGYATLEPGTSRQEFISFTGVTQSSTDSTATLTGLTRGLSPNYPYTSDTANYAESHAAGSIIVISNPPQLYDNLTSRENKETINNEWTFNTPFVLPASSTPYFTSLPTISSSTQLTTKDYVDGVALAGAPVAATSTQGISGVVRTAEPIEMASSSIYAVHGTTSPLVIGIMFSTADPIALRDTATNTWYAVITQSDLTINGQFQATTSEDAYRWGGLATFGDDINFQGFGIATSSPGTYNLLSVDGNAYFGGTTTTGSLIATTTSIRIGGISYEFPGTEGASGTQLTTDGAGQLAWQFENEIELITPLDFPAFGWATTTATRQLNSNTTASYGLFNVARKMDVSKITFDVTAVGTGGTLDIAIYTVRDGTVTKVVDVTSGSITDGGFVTVATTTTALNPGTYYIGFLPNSTADITLQSSAYNDTITRFSQISGEPLFCVQETSAEASVLPDTINETTGEDSTACIMVRLDN